MEIQNKVKLSSDLIVTKLICAFTLLLCLVLVFGRSLNTVNYDFKTDLEYKLFLVVTAILTGYILTRPSIYYDDTNLYIKKVNKKEIIIPLKNIKSFFENPLSANKGTAIFSIEFTDKASENASIKFTAYYSADSIKNFKTLVKKINPRVEIV